MTNYSKIRRLSASIGGYWGGVIAIDINLITRRMKWQLILQAEEKSFEKTLRLSTINRFIGVLEEAMVLDWEENYEDLDILDGTQWSVCVEIEDFCIEKHGSNSFPPTWEIFAFELQRVTGKVFK